MVENDDNRVEIKRSLTTIPHSWDIIFNDDYTIGKILENSFNTPEMAYCGYLKVHPHDDESTLRIAFKKETAFDDVIEKIVTIIDENIDLFNTLGNSLIDSNQKK